MQSSTLTRWTAGALAVAGLAISARMQPAARAQSSPDLPDLGGQALTIGSDTAYPPFEFVNEENEIVGFDVDLFDAICEQVNCTATFQTAGFDGIFAALAAGEYDAVASAVTITEERSRVVDFSRPYLNAGQVVTVAVDSDIDGVEALEDKTIGVQLGTTGDLEASNYTSDANVKRYQTIDLAMAALAQGDLDGVIADAPTSADMIAQEFEDELMIVGEPFTTEFYGLAVQQSTPEVTEAINAGIAALIEDGTLAELAEKWGLPSSAVENLPDSGL